MGILSGGAVPRDARSICLLDVGISASVVALPGYGAGQQDADRFFFGRRPGLGGQ